MYTYSSLFWSVFWYYDRYWSDYLRRWGGAVGWASSVMTMIWITVWYALHFRFLRTHQDVEGLNRLFERLPDYSEIVAIGIVYGLHLLIYRNDSIWDAVSTRHLRMSVEKQRAFRVLSLLLIVSVVLWFIVELRMYWNAGRDWYAV